MKFTCLAALLVLGSVCSTMAQLPEPLSISFGAHTDQAAGASYSITAGGQSEQNRQDVQFRIERSPQAKSSTETAAVTLRTGKQKTVGQVLDLSRKVFQKFLDGQPAHTALGKLGSLEKGGEVIFVAESSDVLRFDFKSLETEPASIRFSRTDAAAFAAILRTK